VITGAVLGLGIGLLLGLLGGGGSILAVPALVFGAGVPLSEAVPISLLVVGISAVTALLPRLRHGHIAWRIAAIFGAAGAGAAFAGAAVNRLLNLRVVLVGFAVLMIAAGIRMLAEHTEHGGDCALPGGGVNWRACLPKAIGAGLGVGFLTGLFGVGGGFLIIPALVLLLGLPIRHRRPSRPGRGASAEHIQLDSHPTGQLRSTSSYSDARGGCTAIPVAGAPDPEDLLNTLSRRAASRRPVLASSSRHRRQVRAHGTHRARSATAHRPGCPAGRGRRTDDRTDGRPRRLVDRRGPIHLARAPR
jgi:hypothetical protein